MKAALRSIPLLGATSAIVISISALGANAGAAEDCASHDIQTALRACSLIIEQGPTREVDVPMALFNRGRSYLLELHLDLALADLNAALHLREDFPEALATRGSTYFAMGRYDLAIADVTRVISLTPDRAAIYFNRGNAYAKLGRFEEALQDFQTTISLDGTIVPAHMAIATIHIMRRDRDSAIAVLRKVTALEPGNANALESLRMLGAAR